MELILQEEVPALGREGDIVDVARGYANNYLIPKGLAIIATPGNLKQLEHKKAGIAKRREAARAQAQKTADKFNEKKVVVNVRAGEGGRLYGSVTSSDISRALEEDFKVEVDRRRILLGEPIKEAGDVDVRIRLEADVEAVLTISVVPDIAEVADAEPETEAETETEAEAKTSEASDESETA